MTEEGVLPRLAYQVALHGGKYLETLGSSMGYEMLTDVIFGGAAGELWNIFVDGVNLLADIGFNASNIFNSTIELHTICQLAEETRNRYENCYILFIHDPVRYYSDFVHANENMLNMTELEYQLYLELRDQVFSNPVNSTLIYISVYYGHACRTK